MHRRICFADGNLGATTLATHDIRIIGGKFRGRKLRLAPIPSLRPTLGRVRKTLFSWLQGEVDDARVLDLFAGSGALGLEALSRGARHVTFIDSHPKAGQRLKQTLSTLALPTGVAAVRIQNAVRTLQRPPLEPFDLIFVDPPFDQAASLIPTALRHLATDRWLAKDGALYLELPLRCELDLVKLTREQQLIIDKDKRAGDCRFLLLRPQDDDQAANQPNPPFPQTPVPLA